MCACQVRFQPLDDTSEGGCRAIGSAALAHAAKLLGCPGIALSLVQRVIISGRQEPITVALSAAQASSARDALSKAIYVAAFKHICARFNEAAGAIGGSLRAHTPRGDGRKIGVGRSPNNPEGGGDDAGYTDNYPEGRSALRRSPEHAEYTENYPEGHGAARRSPEHAEYTENYPEGRGAARRSAELSTPGSRAPPDSTATFVGLLDMFGFEVFNVNSFEQLCINLANEKLQSYFQRCVFVSEEEVHRLEGVPWPADLEYHDNRGCVTLVEKSILRLLDEACGLQNAAEENFFLRVNDACGRDPFFTAPRRNRLLEEEGFIIRHFAGDVCYCSAAAANKDTNGNASYQGALADTWLVKNADRLLPELAKELRLSTSPLVSAIFSRNDNQDMASGTRMANTVARRFTADIDSLVRDLSQTKTLFVRCIKPNDYATPKNLDKVSVLAQLRCLGMTDVVHLMHKAFPTRIPYSELHGRYAAALPPVVSALPPRDFCEAVALMCDVSKADMQLGTTRLFLRGGKGAFLEDLGAMDVEKALPLLLAKIDQMNKSRAAGKILACLIWGWFVRTRFQRQRRASTVMCSAWRGSRDRAGSRKLRDVRNAELQLAVAAQAVVPRQETPLARPVEQTSPQNATPMFDTLFPVTPSANVVDSCRPVEASSRGSSSAGASAADDELFALLGLKPLDAAQLRAIHALRQRLGERLTQNTMEVEGDNSPPRHGVTGIGVPGIDKIPKRRRLMEHSTIKPNGLKAPPKGVPAPSWVDRGFTNGSPGRRIEISLTRDARDGTLGIDLDQFAGLPTVAIIVKGGPAERDGTVRVGDIVLAVDGTACGSISEVIRVLSSPVASAKNPLTFTVLRKPTFIVAAKLLMVRAMPPASVSDGLGGIATTTAPPTVIDDQSPGYLKALARWTPCHCALHSDRRLNLREPSLNMDVAFDLRAALSVQVVTLEASAGPELSCLQIRMPDGIIEFRSSPSEMDGNASLLLWRRTLEEMLMLSLSSSLGGWLYNILPLHDLNASSPQFPRVYFDLNSRSQLRTLCDTRPLSTCHLGMIELSELQCIELVELPPHAVHANLTESTLALQLMAAEHSCLLTCRTSREVETWAKELRAAHRRALITLVQYTGLILIDGWLEYQGNEDEWASGFFVLTIGNGLQCFEGMVNDPSRGMAIESIPVTQITGAVRSKGIDYYDWCIDVRTIDNDYIRVRPPRQAEMTRWLATINVYCTPPPKQKDTRRRQAGMMSPGNGVTKPRPPVPADYNVPKLPASRPPPPSGRPSPATPAVPGMRNAARDFAEQRGGSSGSTRDDSELLSGMDSAGQGGLVQGWAPTSKRRSSSFSRRRNHISSVTSPSHSEVPKAHAPSRGGRLSTKTDPETMSSAAPASASTAPSTEDLGLASDTRRTPIRRPSFGRRRTRVPASETQGAQPTGSRPDSPNVGSMKSDATQPMLMGGDNMGRQQPFRARALSFGRRRAPPKGDPPPISRINSAPDGAESEALLQQNGGAVVSVPDGCVTATPSSCSSEYSDSTSASTATSARVSRQNSFGRRMVRRAASFTARRATHSAGVNGEGGGPGWA